MLIKRITSAALIFSLTLSMIAVKVTAGNVDLINLDFQNVTFDEFTKTDGVTIYNGESGDKLSIETENSSTDNKAFKIFRPSNIVADANNKNGSYAELGFKIELPETIKNGMVRVSFKVRTADGYSFRSRWKNLGSAVTSDGKYKAQFVTHSGYLYTNGTSTVVGSLNSNKWYTISYDLYVDQNKIIKGYDVAPTGGDVKCNEGDFKGLTFNVAFTNAYWTSCNSGDLCYWVDDIKVSANKLVITDTTIKDGKEDVKVEQVIEATFDSKINPDKIDSFISIKENGVSKNVSASLKDDYTVIIDPEGGLQYNSTYDIVIGKDIPSMNGLTMLSDYKFSFKTVSVINTSIENGKRYTQGYLPEFDEMDGITYEYKLSCNGNEEEYKKTPIDEIGEYVLKITGTDANGKKQEETLTFSIIGAVSPYAENVKITGDPIINTVLKGDYDYYDENEDKEGKTIFKWYRSDKADGDYKEITNADKKEYTLTKDDEDSYIKFSVTPVAVKEPFEGKEVFSEYFVSAMNPVVTDIKVTGDIGEDKELKVTYKYYDENGDSENDTIKTWYSSDSENGEFKAVGNGDNYVLTNNENEKYLKVGITPKNTGSGTQEKEYFSDVFSGPSKPVAEDVEIIGNMNVGTAVGVQYKYYDRNNDQQGETVIKWYVGGVLKSESEAYTVTKDDKGKEIYVTVTPVSTVKPFEGETVKSDSKKIPSSSKTTVSSGGKNTGGGGGGTAPIVPITPEVVEKSEEVLVPQPGENMFNDVLNHWAKAEILEMAGKNIINGKEDKTFAPDDNIKRGEFAAIIARAYSMNAGEEKIEFQDLSESDWCYGYISAIVNAGFMKGSDGKFRPWDNITRQEIAVVLSNIARSKGISPKMDAPEFKDSEEIADWAKEDVKFAAELGLLNGVDSSYFAPKSDATRAQVVVIIKRLLDM